MGSLQNSSMKWRFTIDTVSADFLKKLDYYRHIKMLRSLKKKKYLKRSLSMADKEEGPTVVVDEKLWDKFDGLGKEESIIKIFCL